MMVVTWPKMEAYSREEVIIRKRQNSCKLLGINTRNMSSTVWDFVAYIIVRIQKGSNLYKSDFFVVCISGDIAKSDGCHAGHTEVEGGDVHCEGGGTPNHLIMRILNA